MRFQSRLAASLVLVCISLIAFAGAPHSVVAAAEGVRDLAMATPESVGISSDRLKRLDAAMKKWVDSGRIAGAVTMLTRRGKTVHATVNGKKDIRKPDAIDKDSTFRIYSMTKPVTGVAMMMSYEEGLWRLDDPVSRYVPEFAKLQVFVGENADGTMKTEPARRSITMRELMTHTGGLGYGLSAASPVDRMFRSSIALNGSVPLQQLVEGVAKIPLRMPAVEKSLVGQTASEEVFREACEECRKLEALADVHAPASYRQHLATVMSRRALMAAHNRVGGRA